MRALLGDTAKGEGNVYEAAKQLRMRAKCGKIFSSIIFWPRKASCSFFVLRVQENGCNLSFVLIYSSYIAAP